jgi:multidrug efflux pump subunit AcrA (membrane-fusion protein)
LHGRPLFPELLVREFPGRAFSAQVAGASGALDPASRTLLTEVRTRNDGDVLRPGMYADVRFHLQRERPPLLIPTSALIIRAGGPRVATVGPDQKIRYQMVELGRDYGATVEIVRGLSEQHSLTSTPPDGLAEGATVRAAPAAAPPKNRPS